MFLPQRLILSQEMIFLKQTDRSEYFVRETAMILVTGATGHIGNVLIRELTKRGERIRALILPGEDTTSLNGLDIEKMDGNILVPGAVREALADVEYVYHLAGLISIRSDDNDLVHRVNVQGTRNVALAAREYGVKKLVYVSSIHALTRPGPNAVIDETLPFDPDNPAGEYDRSKAEASLIVKEMTETGLNAVIACPTGIIGPDDFRRSELGTTIAGWMRHKLHFMIDGWFDFVDVRDVVDGLIRACEIGRNGETYILSGTYIHLAELRNRVQSSAAISSPMITVPGRLAKIISRAAEPLLRWTGSKSAITPYSIETVQEKNPVSSQKARKHLGYYPRPFAETIHATVDWWKANDALYRYPKWYGKVALVVGASRGIGAATAKRLAKMGMMVVLVSKNEEHVKTLAARINANGGKAEYVSVDFSRDDAAEIIRQNIEGRYHGVDVLVNNAGGLRTVNNRFYVRLSAHFLPNMIKRKRGHIINVDAMNGRQKGVKYPLLTKSFLSSFSLSLRRELAGTGISVSTLHSGFTAADVRGFSIPNASEGASSRSIADAITGLINRPRKAAYAPDWLRLVPLIGGIFSVRRGKKPATKSCQG